MKQLTPELQARIEAHLEQGTLKKALDDADEAKQLLDAGRKQGQQANQRNAAARWKFIEQVARAKYKEFPNITVAALVQEAVFALRDRRHQFSFGSGRYPKTSAIAKFIERLGLCDE